MTIDAPVRKGGPPLVVGGTCRKGHLLQAGDIAPVGNGHACRICKNIARQRHDHGLSGPYRCTTRFRCGHPKTTENTDTAGHCRECHRAGAYARRHASEQYKDCQVAKETRLVDQKTRRDAILANWLAGKSMHQIARQLAVSTERIRQIVIAAGGVTIRVMRADLNGLEGKYKVARND